MYFFYRVSIEIGYFFLIGYHRISLLQAVNEASKIEALRLGISTSGRGRRGIRKVVGLTRPIGRLSMRMSVRVSMGMRVCMRVRMRMRVSGAA